MLENTTIPYRDTGFFSKTVLDYLDDDSALRPFYAYEPVIGSVPEIMETIPKKRHVEREVLANAILKQYVTHSITDKILSNIELLRDEKTFTVTTAHQLNIFTGPLYYIYKILNAIRVASDLNKQFPDHKFVPCYWMGSEDHDFEEVNHIHLFNKEIKWDNFQGGSMGTYSTGGITDLIPEIREILRDGDHLDQLLSTMKDAYSRPLLSEAVREMLLQLFGSYGLVVIDGNCKELKRPFTKVLIDELTNQSSSSIVDHQTIEMATAGYKSQAGPREINLFYAFDRKRNRIMPDENGFKLADDDQVFSRVEMLKLVEEHPERFSPNVILRPLHQQMVLPNIAYIGGGSEVAYWMQLRTLFDHHQVHFPMLLLRTSAQFIPSQVGKKLAKLNIDLKDIFLSEDVLKKNFVAASHQGLDLNEEKAALELIFKDLHQKASQIDASMDSWVGAEEKKAINSLENISKRLIKAGKSRDEQSMLQIDKTKARLFPGSSLQERKENFMSYYSDKGKLWLDDLLETLDPFEKKFYLFY